MGRSWLTAVVVCTLVALAGPEAGEVSRLETLRDLVTAPERYANRPIRITGRFRGRPDRTGSSTARPPGRSRWDFLLTWEDAAVWVTGLRPVGRDFDLDPASPHDAGAGRLLEVIGTVRVSHGGTAGCAAARPCGRFWIEASDLHLAVRPGSTRDGPGPRAIRRQPRVVFNDPIDDESGVSPDTAVRLQFSQHLVPETLSGRLRVSYAPPQPLAAAPLPAFTAVYEASTRSIAVRFAAPLAEGRRVRVEVLPGISTLDGRPLEPWSFSFTTGSASAMSAAPAAFLR
jgi:hypothetical protein